MTAGFMSSSTDARDAIAAAAAALERTAADPALADELDGDELRRLLAAAVRTFVRRVETGGAGRPFPAALELQPTATDLMVVVTEFLAACQIELFELGMWQSWGGVRTIEEPVPPAGEGER